MINGDHAHPEPECAACRDRGWIDDMSTAVRFLRRCPECEARHARVAVAH